MGSDNPSLPVLLLLALLVAGLWGCKEPVTESHAIDASQAELSLASREESLANETCEQTPWGQPIAGSATDLIYALYLQDGLLASCHAAIDDAYSLADLLRTGPGKALPLVEAENEKIARVREACKEVPVQIAKLARFSTGCSPYTLDGPDGKMLHGGATTFDPHMNIAVALTIEAQTIADEGQRLVASMLLLQGIRFFESTRLGGVDLDIEAGALAGFRLLFSSLRRIALETNWQAAERKELVEALAGLVRADTGASDVARAHLFALREAMPTSGPDQVLRSPQPYATLETLRAAACPVGQSYQRCVDAFVALDRGLITGTIPKTPQATKVNTRIKRMYASLGLSYHTETLKLRGQRLASLVALEAALRSQQGGECPTTPLDNSLGGYHDSDYGEGLVAIWLPFQGPRMTEILRYRCDPEKPLAP